MHSQLVVGRSSVVLVVLAVLLIAITIGCADGTFAPATSPSSLTVKVPGSFVVTPTTTTVGNSVSIRTDAEGTGLRLDACLAGASSCQYPVLVGGEATFVPGQVGEYAVTLRRWVAEDNSFVLATTKVVVR